MKDLGGFIVVSAFASGLVLHLAEADSLGWTVLLLGVAIACRSLIALTLVAAFAIFAIRYARIEEREISGRFGDAYEQYSRHTAPMLKAP